jgi:hypothetical protein
MRLVAAVLAGLVLGAGTTRAESTAAPGKPSVVVQGHLGRNLDEYMTRLESSGS